MERSQQPLQGVILVGGASRRMGVAKATLTRGQTTQGAFLAHLLEQQLGCVPWLSGTGPAGIEGLERVADRIAGEGPLSALLGLFDRSPQSCFVVLACDLFAFDASALQWLLRQARDSDRAAVWPRLPQRAFGEPLAAVYTPAARPWLEAAWGEGNRAARKGLPQHARAEPQIPPNLQRAFCGANTPEQWADINGSAGDPIPG